MQKEIVRVVGINLAIILLFALLSGMSGSSFSLNSFGMIGGLIACILTPINGILSAANFSNDNKELSKAYLLAMALCLLIGWSLCSTIGQFSLH